MANISNDLNYWRTVGMGTGALSAHATEAGISRASEFAMKMNGGYWPDQYSLFDSAYTTPNTGVNNNNGNTTTTYTQNPDGTVTTTTTTTTTTTGGVNNQGNQGSIFNSNTGYGSYTDPIMQNFYNSQNQITQNTQNIVDQMNINQMTQNVQNELDAIELAEAEITSANGEERDEYGNEIVRDANGKQYNPERVDTVNKLLESEAKQQEFERLAKKIDSAIEGESSERDQKRTWYTLWIGKEDTDKENKWQDNGDAIKDAYENMTKEEIAAFNEYYKARSKAATGVEQTPAQALGAANNGDRDVITNGIVDVVAQKSDEASEWLNELPTGKTDATIAREAKEAEQIQEAREEGVKKAQNKLDDMQIEADYQRQIGNENLALQIEKEIAKLQNDITDITGETETEENEEEVAVA